MAFITIISLMYMRLMGFPANIKMRYRGLMAFPERIGKMRRNWWYKQGWTGT